MLVSALERVIRPLPLACSLLGSRGNCCYVGSSITVLGQLLHQLMALPTIMMALPAIS